MRKIILSKVDHLRIQKCIKDAMSSGSISGNEAERLTKELEIAKVVEPQEIPPDVVTMHSVVKVSFLNTKKQVQFQLVYPREADMKSGKISILSPVATALIGYRKNDELEWIVPAGVTKIRIDEIVYQPEAAGDYNL